MFQWGFVFHIIHVGVFFICIWLFQATIEFIQYDSMELFFFHLHRIQKYHRELSILSIFTTLLVQFLGLCKSLLKRHRILRHIDLNLLIQSSRCVSLCLLLSSYLLRSFFNRVSVIHLGLFLSMHMFMLLYTCVWVYPLDV